MRIERDIREKVISRRLKLLLKKAPGVGAGVLICCLGHHSPNIFRTLPAHFAIFFLICLEPDYKESFSFLICRREMKQLGEL